VAKSAAPLRLVLDTNIIISGLLWSGTPRQLLDRASDDPSIRLFTSEALINELLTSLGYRKFEKRLSQAGMAIDDAVAAVAIAAKAHAIGSGDKDLYSLEQIWGIPVLRPGETLELLNERARTQPK
jgi:hypothetical protein